MPPRRRRRPSIAERIADEAVDLLFKKATGGMLPADEVFSYTAEMQTRVVLESGAPVMGRRAAIALEPGDVLEMRVRRSRKG